jgi:hypothetical protein
VIEGDIPPEKFVPTPNAPTGGVRKKILLGKFWSPSLKKKFKSETIKTKRNGEFLTELSEQFSSKNSRISKA